MGSATEGVWKSKTSDLTVQVIKITDDAVFWECPEVSTFTERTNKQVFMDSMEKLEAD